MEEMSEDFQKKVNDVTLQKPIVLLVEPRKHKLALASLMKFSAYFKQKGYRVFYVCGISYFNLPKHVDIAIISSVFTFDLKDVISCTKYYQEHYNLPPENVRVGGIAVSLMKDWVEEQLEGKATIHVGLDETVDQMPLDYSLYPNIDYSIIWTTRGCVRNCEFCMVPKIEGKLHYIENWERYVNVQKPRIQAIDNNFTAAKKSWFESVCNRLEYFGKTVDFNQSVDCRLFREFHAINLSKVRMECLRFSYDGDHVPEDKVRDAIEIAQGYGFNDIRFDALYNFKDTPEEFFHRLDVLNSLNCKIFPMKFVPLNYMDRDYVGENWTYNYLVAFNKLMGIGFSNGMIGNGKNSRETFITTFGANADEFVEKLKSFAVNKKGNIIEGQQTMNQWFD